MFSRIVLLLQAVELGLYAVLGTWLHVRHGFGVAFLVASAIVVALEIRLAITLAAFVLSWIHRTPRAPEHRLGVASTVALVVREWIALVTYNLAYLPWERALLGPDPHREPLERPALVLVHGYMANRGCFHALAANLRAAGLGPVLIPNLRSWLAPIEQHEAGLAEFVANLNRDTGQPVILVAHSMGGLSSRLMLATRGSAGVARLITIASPHHGTALAGFGFGENSRQMARGSAFVETLARNERDRPSGVPVTSIYSTHDNLVAPQATSRLEGAKNIALPGRGHLDILASAELVRLIAEEIRA
jgi:triacylglycerol lipase